MKRFLTIALASASCVLGSHAAMAAYVADYSGDVLLGSWEQSMTPSVVSFVTGHYSEVVITNGTGAVFGYSSVFWYNSLTENGGILAGDPGGTHGDLGSPINSTGPQSYSGTESAPILALGTYHEYDGTTLVVSVPEPATWAMMLVGLGMVGFAARRRNVAVSYG